MSSIFNRVLLLYQPTLMKKCMALVCDSIEEDLSGVGLKEIDLPELSSKDVLINVKAASVNFPDLLMSQGKYQNKPEYFLQSYDIVGLPNDFNGDKPVGIVGKGHTYKNTWEDIIGSLAQYL